MAKKKNKNGVLNNSLDDYSSMIRTNPLNINTMYTQAPLALAQKRSIVSQNWQLLSFAYMNYGIVQRFINQPIEDGLRGGVTITSKNLDDKDIAHLGKRFEEIGLATVKNTMKWARLYGGAGIIINSVGAEKTPLDLDKIPQGSELDFYDADLWELNYKYGVYNANQLEENINTDWNGGVWYNYYGIPIHKSRVLRVENIKAPALIRRSLRGWGASVLEATLPQISLYTKLEQVFFELVDEAKIDVYKLTGFNTALASQTEDTILKKLRMLQMNKNFQNGIAIDSEDDFTNKQLSFGGLAEIMAEMRVNLASVLNMPVSKLFGTGSSGFSSGEDDIETYNCMIESTIRAGLRPVIKKVLQIICQVEFGFVPDDLDFDFKSLRILGEEAQQNVFNAQFQRLMESLERGVIDTKMVRKSINKLGLLPLAINEDDELYEEEIEALSSAPKTKVKKSTPTNITFGQKANSLINEVKRLTKRSL